jgi:hypothetical protein
MLKKWFRQWLGLDQLAARVAAIDATTAAQIRTVRGEGLMTTEKVDCLAEEMGVMVVFVERDGVPGAIIHRLRKEG